MHKLLLSVLLPVLGVALLLLTVAIIGEATHEARDPVCVNFADIDCEPPPGSERAEFLDEVQYLASAADCLNLHDEELPQRLAAAFALHPWVEHVEQVKLAPPRRVQVGLRYRVPVLAVDHDGQFRAVDRHGILLPASAAVDGLPVYPRAAGAPQGPAGTPWGDPAVEEAARTVQDTVAATDPWPP